MGTATFMEFGISQMEKAGEDEVAFSRGASVVYVFEREFFYRE